MTPLTGVARSVPQADRSQSGYPQRMAHAAQEFETQLLINLLRPLQKTFATVPGQDAGRESDGYTDMGTEALAAGLSAAGGVGIAKMLVHEIASTEVLASAGRKER